MDLNWNKIVYEDDLPFMTGGEYAIWYDKSHLVDGVRMGPEPILK